MRDASQARRAASPIRKARSFPDSAGLHGARRFLARPRRRPQHSHRRLPVAHRAALRSRRALVITETELALMAALASIGESSTPRNG